MNRYWRKEMKTTKLFLWILLTVIWCFSLSSPGLAQDWYSALFYQMSFPTGDTKDFISETSFRGIGLDFRKALNSETTVGVFVGWNIFYERTDETIQLYTQKPGAITGTQNRYLFAFPMMATVHRYFGEKRGFRPYVGLGLGGFIMLQRLEIGIVSLENEPWEWAIAPEVGFILPIEGGAMMVINTKYNYAFTGESITGKDTNHSYWGLNIGFAWASGGY